MKKIFYAIGLALLMMGVGLGFHFDAHNSKGGNIRYALGSFNDDSAVSETDYNYALGYQMGIHYKENEKQFCGGYSKTYLKAMMDRVNEKKALYGGKDISILENKIEKSIELTKKEMKKVCYMYGFLAGNRLKRTFHPKGDDKLREELSTGFKEAIQGKKSRVDYTKVIDEVMSKKYEKKIDEELKKKTSRNGNSDNVNNTFEDKDYDYALGYRTGVDFCKANSKKKTKKWEKVVMKISKGMFDALSVNEDERSKTLKEIHKKIMKAKDSSEKNINFKLYAYGFVQGIEASEVFSLKGDIQSKKEFLVGFKEAIQGKKSRVDYKKIVASFIEKKYGKRVKNTYQKLDKN